VKEGVILLVRRGRVSTNDLCYVLFKLVRKGVKEILEVSTDVDSHPHRVSDPCDCVEIWLSGSRVILDDLKNWFFGEWSSAPLPFLTNSIEVRRIIITPASFAL
jgi:hypothetical protein